MSAPHMGQEGMNGFGSQGGALALGRHPSTIKAKAFPAFCLRGGPSKALAMGRVEAFHPGWHGKLIPVLQPRRGGRQDLDLGHFQPTPLSAGGALALTHAQAPERLVHWGPPTSLRGIITKTALGGGVIITMSSSQLPLTPDLLGWGWNDVSLLG